MNPISSVVKGSYDAAASGAKSAAKKAASGIPNPSEAVYNLGMGIGPMLRSIADEMKRDKQKESKDSGKKDSQLIGRKDLAQISTQFNTMISVLKDLKSIGMMQLRKDQQRALEARRQSFFDKEAALEGGIKPQITATQTLGSDGSKAAFGGALGGILGLLTPGKLIAAGGLAAIWTYILDDKSKELLKKQSKELVGAALTSATETIKEAFKDNPALTLGVAALTAFVLGPVGWLAKSILIPLGAVLTKGIYSAGAGLATRMTMGQIPGANKAITAGAPAGTSAALPAASAAATAASTSKLKPSERIAQRAALAAANSKLAAAEAAQAVEAQKTIKAAASASQTAKALGFLSRGLGAIGILGSGLYAANSFSQGKNITGSLAAASAATGTLAAGAAITGVGLPAAGILGGISALLGVGSGIAGYFEGGDSKNNGKGQTASGKITSAVEGQPTPSATGSSGYRSAGSLEDVKGVVYHHSGGDTMEGALAALAQRELSYNYMIDKNGKIHQMMPDGVAARHGGVMGGGFTNTNTIGVSLIAKDDASVTQQQLEAARGLHKKLAAKYGFNPDMAYGHGQVSGPDVRKDGTQKQPTEGLTAVNVVKGGGISSNIQSYTGAGTGGSLVASDGSIMHPSNISGSRANDSEKVNKTLDSLIMDMMKIATGASLINIDQSKSTVSSSSGGGGSSSFSGGLNDSSIKNSVNSLAFSAQ